MGRLDEYWSCGHLCLIISICGFLFMTFLAGICAFDPHRLHVIGHGEEDHGKVSAAWGSAAVAAFLYLLIAGGLLACKYMGAPEQTIDDSRWLKQTNNAQGLAKEYEMNEFKNRNTNNS